jgi:hypothetical protein
MRKCAKLEVLAMIYPELTGIALCSQSRSAKTAGGSKVLRLDFLANSSHGGFKA